MSYSWILIWFERRYLQFCSHVYSIKYNATLFICKCFFYLFIVLFSCRRINQINSILKWHFNKYVDPPYCWAEMYACRVARCPWRVTVTTPTGQTDGRTPDRYMTLSADAISIIRDCTLLQWSTGFQHTYCFVSALGKVINWEYCFVISHCTNYHGIAYVRTEPAKDMQNNFYLVLTIDSISWERRAHETLSRSHEMVYLVRTRYFFTSPSEGGWNIAISLCVCFFVYLSVRVSQKTKTTSKLHEIFHTCYLWQWLGPPWQQCHTLCTSGIANDAMFTYNGANRPESRTTSMFGQVRQVETLWAKSAVSDSILFSAIPARLRSHVMISQRQITFCHCPCLEKKIKFIAL